jgi:hypothetical protein
MDKEKRNKISREKEGKGYTITRPGFLLKDAYQEHVKESSVVNNSFIRSERIVQLKPKDMNGECLVSNYENVLVEQKIFDVKAKDNVITRMNDSEIEREVDLQISDIKSRLKLDIEELTSSWDDKINEETRKIEELKKDQAPKDIEYVKNCLLLLDRGSKEEKKVKSFIKDAMSSAVVVKASKQFLANCNLEDASLSGRIERCNDSILDHEDRIRSKIEKSLAVIEKSKKLKQKEDADMDLTVLRGIKESKQLEIDSMNKKHQGLIEESRKKIMERTKEEMKLIYIKRGIKRLNMDSLYIRSVERGSRLAKVKVHKVTNQHYHIDKQITPVFETTVLTSNENVKVYETRRYTQLEKNDIITRSNLGYEGSNYIKKIKKYTKTMISRQSLINSSTAKIQSGTLSQNTIDAYESYIGDAEHMINKIEKKILLLNEKIDKLLVKKDIPLLLTVCHEEVRPVTKTVTNKIGETINYKVSKVANGKRHFKAVKDRVKEEYAMMTRAQLRDKAKYFIEKQNIDVNYFLQRFITLDLNRILSNIHIAVVENLQNSSSNELIQGRGLFL